MEATQKKAHLRPALFITIVMIAIHCWIHVSGQTLNPTLLLAATLPMIVGIVYTVFQHAKENPANTFGNNFAYGFRIAVVVMLLALVFSVIFFKAFPQYKDRLLDNLLKSADRKNSGMDDQMIAKSIQDWDKHFSQRLSTIYIFLHIIPGAIASAIAAAFSTRKIKTT